MGRLIDADAFDKRIRLAVGSCEEELTEDFKDGISTILEMMKTAPTVDAVPVVHGRWIRVYSRPGVFKYLGWTCDQCGQRTGNEYAPQWYKFCPNCGARMDGDGNG